MALITQRAADLNFKLNERTHSRVDFFLPIWEQWLLILLRPLMSSAVDGAVTFSADLQATVAESG